MPDSGKVDHVAEAIRLAEAAYQEEVPETIATRLIMESQTRAILALAEEVRGLRGVAESIDRRLRPEVTDYDKAARSGNLPGSMGR